MYFMSWLFSAGALRLERDWNDASRLITAGARFGQWRVHGAARDGPPDQTCRA